MKSDTPRKLNQQGARIVVSEPSNPARRNFLKNLSVVGSLAVAPAFIHPLGAEWGEDFEDRDSIFPLGVASGDPKDDSVVLWTRLAPDPLNGGGMRNRPVEVVWKVATDPAMHHVVRTGNVTAHPRNGHAVSVNVDGLWPGTWYYYEFRYAGKRSRIGRTRTFPSPWATPPRMRFALVSCQHYEQGFYAAYRDIVRQRPDFVVHVGDYIYENGATPEVPAERRHTGGETTSVEDYRNRYALYRLDRDLQNAHAACPFITTWDDHEVDNNCPLYCHTPQMENKLSGGDATGKPDLYCAFGGPSIV